MFLNEFCTISKTVLAKSGGGGGRPPPSPPPLAGATEYWCNIACNSDNSQSNTKNPERMFTEIARGDRLINVTLIVFQL